MTPNHHLPPLPSPELSALDSARLMVDAAADKKAQDIVLFDVKSFSSLADYFIVCSAQVERQIRAIAEGIEEALDAVQIPPYRREGTPSDGWVLLDYGDVIVHVMSNEQRDYYRLEQLWEQAHIVVRIQ
ncbi:MAG TPA: ribosome silencing factor [Chloroflexota bacterium]